TVEVGLNEVALGRRLLRELTNFDLAVLRQRANGNDPDLVAREQRDRGFDRRAHLEDRAVSGEQAKIKQSGPEPVGRLVELGKRDAALVTDKNVSPGI